MSISETDTIGPVIFDVPALSTGEEYSINLRSVERNGRKGWFRPYLPLDKVQVTNQSSQQLRAIINNTFEDTVVPNAVETYTNAGATYITVRNTGSSATSAGQVEVSVQRSPYDSDDAARDRKRQGVVSSVVESFTGIRL